MIATGFHAVVLLAAVGLVGYAASPFFHNMPRPTSQPSTMENVDWTSPYGNIYCLACHRQLAHAMAGLDVEQGHSTNVVLKPEQIRAVQEMGMVAGPGGVLICMSCHKLGLTNPHMLADTLTDSRLCRHCHPQQFTAVNTKHDLRTTAPHEKNRFGQTAETGGLCSACHLSHYYARDFEPCELDPDGRCITCHKIGRAAAKFARPTMEHPKTQCIICHNPHDSTNRHFLKKPHAQMCADCHTDFTGGMAKGMHPLGAMRYDVPKVLVDAGAETFGNSRELTCLICHSTHSSAQDPLLVLPADTNQLCLSCHEKELAERAPGGKLPKHGQSPKLTAAQRAVVEGRGARVGPGSELLCVSCHKVHHAEPDSTLLAFRPKSEDACSACHQDKAGVVGTVHDLRTNFPDEKNVAGATPLSAGACSGCHTAHRPARLPVPSAADASGQCTTCHQESGCAKRKLAGALGHPGDPAHPGNTCTACHNPHERQIAHFLLKSPAGLCRECHAEQYSLAGGPHDRSKHPDQWPKGDAGTDGPCMACHVAHGGKGTGLFLAETKADSYHDAVCLTCHANNGWNAPSNLAAIHPQRISPEEKRVPVSLVPVDDRGNMRMGCRTCHNVHGGAEPVHLARVKPGEATESLCMHCHEEKRLINLTSHAPELLTKMGFDVDSCKPCHAMHARPVEAWGYMLSPRFLLKSQQVTTRPTGGGMPCSACHHAGGPAPVREVSSHPWVLAFNVVESNAAGYMPLFNDDGKEAVNGQITCRTCHLAHGRVDRLKAVASGPAMTDAQRSAARLQVRPFVPPNLCTQCHGGEALFKFMYFHNLAKRAKPKE
jgi:predicted CXXCH cytochrome family protein